MTNKELVIDTNILLSDGSALKKFGENTVNIPFVVLQELDKHKTTPGDVGVNARTTIKILDTLREQGDLRVGVLSIHGPTIKVSHEDFEPGTSPDDQIIQTAARLQKEGKEVELISNDINVRVKASLFGVYARGHNGEQIHIDESEIYTGITSMEVDGEIIDKLHASGVVYVEDLVTDKKLHPNQYIHFVDSYNDKHTAVGQALDDISITKMRNIRNVFGIKPRNLEQACALDLLLDSDIPLVSLMGLAGSGKTLIALAAALDLILRRGEFQKLIIIRPPIPMGKDIGFLPGSMEEKVIPWMGAIIDNFDMLIDGDEKYSFEYLLHSGLIEIMPPTYIRGRSLAHSIILVDEAQSLSLHEAKTIVTRIHESSKLIMTGDVRQIDNRQLSAVDNGFSHVVNAFKPYDIAGHVTLNKCERGSLASLAAELL